MKWNIYRKMFLFAIAMIILPVLLLGFLSFSESKSMLEKRIKNSSMVTMENASNHFIKYYIGDIEKTLDLLAKDAALNENATERSPRRITNKLDQHRSNSDNIWSIVYISAEDEIYTAPPWNPSAKNELRSIPWYKSSIQAVEVEWGEPHIEPITGNTVVTAAKAIYEDGTFKGVVAINTSLYKLSDIIRNINIGAGGYLILIDSKGNILAHSDLSLIGTNVSNSVWFNKLMRTDLKSVHVELDDSSTYVSAITIPDTGWTLVGFLPEETFNNEAGPIKATTIIVALLGIILASLVSAAVSRGFVARIERLVANVSEIEKGEYEISASDSSTDEIGELNRKFVIMAKKLKNLMIQRDLTETEIQRQKVYFAQLFENSPESIAILDQDNKIVLVNKHFTELFNYKKNEIEGCFIDEVVVPENLRAEGVRLEEIARREYVQAETVRMRKDGSLVDVQVIAYPIIVDGSVVGTYAIYRDISERKAAERQLEYLTYHDSLTGVHNRRYFDRYIEQVSGNGSGSYGVLVFDVDGLKLVNDSFGHARGDELLKKAVELIRCCTPQAGVIARMGGDEFSMVLPYADEIILENMVKDLQTKISEFNSSCNEFTVSLSIGYAIAENGQRISDALQEADSRMYKEKLHRSQSTRSAIVRTLVQALHVRDFITEGHADRMQNMIEQLARKMGIPEFKIHDLRLLAQFHDLGKVGIPDSILFKTESLDPKEQEIMQRHSEIGYRIAIASPELNHIADWILKHHEWWNGNGYPIGLSGMEIPIECRILAICDAYDAMTSERPYRKARLPAEALAEIEACSGTMFDPMITKIFISMIKDKLD
ncbi:diguanylate cyclase domain-containing protein [Dendrosporobacter sp. 1207_IL3150]|uniref:diguanylate cyclase domain-containing protein n=1 Tax=Dendrosporobacter sp. 1207_IL3150 TaxID=3084054 RepID=UPI002FD976AB